MLASSASAAASAPDFFAVARYNMLETQLKPNRILDEKLLAAMAESPREAFVPEDQKSFAYSDAEISIGFGRKMLAPMVLARMIQELQVKPSERILDVGAGTGYTASILNELAGETVALETDSNLLRLLQQNKQELNLQQVSAVNGALCDGFAPASPYPVMLIEGGVQWIPQKLVNQLADGGRLACIFYPEGDVFGRLGEMRIYTRTGDKLTFRAVMDAAGPVLPGLDVRQKFEF